MSAACSLYPLANKRVWVAGHRGMVGSALLRRLRREGCEILTVGREKVDLRRQQVVEEWISETRPQAIFLSAAKVGGILANDTKPAHRSERFAVLGCCLTQASSDLALSGGCAMNSVANGKVRRETAFRRVYVQAAAGDAGGAIGAAFALWHKLGGHRSFEMDHAYWGPHFNAAEIAQLLREKRVDIESAGCVVEEIADEAELCRRTAAEIRDGKVVGWFQGRMEWGPRALGNRSILCDPRRADMKAILNAKIKRRESFRPFAPSVLQDAVGEWFEEDDDVPFMMQVFQIREDKRPLIPAVTHVDGSGRLQTVHRQTNPRYYRLIEAFRDLTDVPMVLNTSFNENEPVVCEPKEALDCFLRTQMDVLVMENTLLARRESEL